MMIKRIPNIIKYIIQLPLDILIALVVMSFITLFSMVAKIDIVSNGSGVITGSDDKINIVSPDPGFINVFSLKTGQKVHKGELLFSYVNLDSFYREKTLTDLVEYSKNKIKEISENLSLLKELKKNDLPDNERYEQLSPELSAYKFFEEKRNFIQQNEYHMLRKEQIEKNIQSLNSQLETLKRKQKLLVISSAPEIDMLNNSTEISKVHEQINAENINILDFDNARVKESNDYNTRLLEEIVSKSQLLSEQKKDYFKNTGDLELLRNKIKSNSVSSPVDGVILDITQNLTSGSYIDSSQLVMKIKKENIKSIIEGRFDAKYRPFLYDGAKVKIVINSPGYKKYFNGYIQKISADSFLDKDMPRSNRYYKVDIEYDNEKNKFSDYNEGVQVSIYAVSKKMTIISYILSVFNSNLVFNVW
ncbi:HlyD family efflux transporter periplasmic adaptor subunit [Salmonella enterica]|nr:HlyD family efflux transporter periplasmic adaptor subunit [Salmonella enterica]